MRGRRGGGAPADPPAWVPQPQGLEKGVVVGTMKAGQQKLVLFGTGETLYKVAAHLCCATEATATAQWQKAKGGGGHHSKPPPPPQAKEAASHTPTPKPTKAAADPAIRSTHTEPANRSAAAEPATGSTEDRARDTQALWESPSSSKL